MDVSYEYVVIHLIHSKLVYIDILVLNFYFNRSDESVSALESRKYRCSGAFLTRFLDLQSPKMLRLTPNLYK